MGEGVPDEVMEALTDLAATVPLYYEDAYLREFEATVLGTVKFKDRLCIVLDQTCFFPEGGGQPSDRGFIHGSKGKAKVIDVQSSNGVIVHTIENSREAISAGEPVHGVIDWNLRYNYMRQHTASHIVHSAVRRVLDVEKLMYMGFQIGEEKSRMDINYGKPITPDQMHEIERLSNQICLQNRPVRARFTTREEAEREYGDRLGVTEVTPTGRVRIVEIEDWDAGLCCGTQVKSTAEAAPVKVLGRLRLQRGVERIEFTAGEPAYKFFDEAIVTSLKLSELFKVAINDLVGRAGQLITDMEGLKNETRRIKDLYIEAEALRMLGQTKPLGELGLITEILPSADVETLRRIALTAVNKNPSLIIVLGSALEKAYIVGAAGQKARDKGIDVREIITEAASLIQGSGGGTPKIAQAGGPEKGKLGEALSRCREKVTLRVIKEG